MRKPVCEKKRGSLVGTVVGLVVCAIVGVLVPKADSTSTAAAIRAIFIVPLACGCDAPGASDLWRNPRSAKGSVALAVIVALRSLPTHGELALRLRQLRVSPASGPPPFGASQRCAAAPGVLPRTGRVRGLARRLPAQPRSAGTA